FAVAAIAEAPLRQPAAVVALALALAAARPSLVPAAPEEKKTRALASAAPAASESKKARALAPAVPERKKTRALALLLVGAAASFLLARATAGWLSSRALSQARDAAPDERRAAIDRAAQIDPRSPEAAFALGVAAFEVDDAPAAAAGFERARALQPSVAAEVA